MKATTIYYYCRVHMSYTSTALIIQLDMKTPASFKVVKAVSLRDAAEMEVERDVD